jgi:hypothetical protein
MPYRIGQRCGEVGNHIFPRKMAADVEMLFGR